MFLNNDFHVSPWHFSFSKSDLSLKKTLLGLRGPFTIWGLEMKPLKPKSYHIVSIEYLLNLYECKNLVNFTFLTVLPI